MRSSRSTPVLIATGASGLLLLGAAAGASAAVTQPEDEARPASGAGYVALGDSFSAGVGTRNSVDEDCYRSPLGYPALVAEAEGLDLSYQSCTGAVTGDVLGGQLGTLGTDTDLVTITIGGNDVGFTDVVIACGQPGWLADCQGAIDEGRAILQGRLPGDLDAVLGQIGTRAPNAEVKVGAYPHLFNGEDCNVLTFFSEEEMTEINTATDELATLIQQRTSAAGFGFVDPRADFVGHAVCDDEEWINGLSVPIVESFHPNVAGNVAYADLFSPGAGALAPAVASTPAADALQEEVDAVLALDLTSPENLAAAEAAGVDTAALEENVALLGSTDRAAQQRGLDGLSALDEEHAERVEK